MTPKLPHDVRTMLREGRGIVVQKSTPNFGVPQQWVRRLAARGLLVELAKGSYAEASAFEIAGSWTQFALRTRAFIASRSDDTHACDFSALALLGLPTFDPPPAMPRGLRPGSAHVGRTTSRHGKVRYGWLPPAHRILRDGLATSDIAYTAVDVARHGSRLQGLMVADAALAGGSEREVLTDIIENLRLYRGIEAARWVVGHADGRSESPLETAGRLVCLQFDLPPVVTNPWITGTRAPRRVDLLLPDHGIILEADGAVKYNNRADAASVVHQEKERAWELTEVDFGVIRYNASLVYTRPTELVGRIRRLMALRRGHPAPTCWQLDPPWAG